MRTTFVLFLFLLNRASSSSSIEKDDMMKEALVAGDLSVLNRHRVVYSEPNLVSNYESGRFEYNPKSMDHLYTITNMFINFVTRRDVIPTNLVPINASSILADPSILADHWQDFLLQYIGVITCAICGILAAIAIPIAGFCVCCCRCAGKCGAYSEPFDKKSDACKRLMLGIFLSVLVIGAMFGVITAFVTNLYTHQGQKRLPDRLEKCVGDTSLYLESTGLQVNGLLVTNFGELEQVLNQVLDESGPILKRSLAEVTQAAAIDDLTNIVSSLGNVKRYLKDIQNHTLALQGQVGQLSLGLNGTKSRLLQALRQCISSRICSEFLKEYNIDQDLTVADTFDHFALPDVSYIMKDINRLMENDIEQKVKLGQKQLDTVKIDIEKSIKVLRPQIKEEIRQMGKTLEDKSAQIQGIFNEFESGLMSTKRDIPVVSFFVQNLYSYMYYIGIGLSCLVCLILVCYILGLFYGFCGKRPGNVYGDDCCNRGTGANWLLAAVYLTFLFSFVLLVMATVHFLVGTIAEKAVCQTVEAPTDSDVFRLIIDDLAKPLLERDTGGSTRPLSEIIVQCHLNKTIYDILDIKSLYDVEKMRNWRSEYEIDSFIGNINIRLDDLREIQILSPQAKEDLEQLAESSISDLNFTNYATLVENKITDVDLPSFTRKLRQVKERVGRSNLAVGAALENEALFLDQMQRVVISMRISLRHLKSAVESLEEEAKFGRSSLREALTELIRRASKATDFLRTEGPQLVDQLTSRYVNETVSLIDGYVERVINRTHHSVGKCWPVSQAYNASVASLCNDIIDPFNGFWASIGICYVFYLIAIALALSLVGLYRKSEPYPGPLVEATNIIHTQPQQNHLRHHPPKAKDKKRRGHRRNPSESYLPDSAHYRAGYSYQNRFQDIAPRAFDGSSSAAGASGIGNRSGSTSSGGGGGGGGPPRYTSNPNIHTATSGPSSSNGPPPPGGEYERPPPYYYPGPDAPPPLPNRN